MRGTYVVNLTSLGTLPEEAELKNINRLSKPGLGYELHLGENGVVYWDGYDNNGSEEPVRVQFEPEIRTLTVRVPHRMNVVIEKVLLA